MVAFEVVWNDNCENTGLDGALFATREEAEEAIEYTKQVFLEFSGEVIDRKNEEPTITLEQWLAKGW